MEEGGLRLNSLSRPGSIPTDHYVVGYYLHPHRCGEFNRYALLPVKKKMNSIYGFVPT